MQQPIGPMSRRADGELATIDDSHEHGGVSGSRGDAETEDDDDQERGDREPFFQCVDRQDPVLAGDDATPAFHSDDDGNGDDVRASFATADDGDRLLEDQAELDGGQDEDGDGEEEDTSRYDYGMWMAPEAMSIQERRRRLLQGMGLASSKDLLRSRNARARLPPDIPRCASRRPAPPQLSSAARAAAAAAANDAPSATAASPAVASFPSGNVRHRQPNAALARSRSDSSRLAARGAAAARKPPPLPPPSLRRANSLPHSLHGLPAPNALCTAARRPLPSAAAPKEERADNARDAAAAAAGAKVKSTGNGKEFVVKGQSNSSDARSCAQVSTDELERFIGYPPFVKRLIRRSQSQPVPAAGAAKCGDEKPAAQQEKKRTRWLKNIKLVATAAGLRNDKDSESKGRPARATMLGKSASANAAVSSSSSSAAAAASGPERLKVHHYGTSSRELTGLYLRQEIPAHEGSIWTVKFSPDGRFLASGGEDHVVRVWRVADAGSSAAQEFAAAAASSLPPPQKPASTTAAAPGLAAQLSRKVRRGRSSKDVLPEHVVVPESVFALAEQPACTFEGHQDDVLDLSWSSMSQQLLSSSMDKTVRLWDMDTRTCLKLFPHNDYVTCVQFNPVDDDHFISGSLDCKVRIWSVPDRQVVDWSDLSDMVTAACYTPDGQAAMIGSHKGTCRFYKTTDCKLNQEAQIDMSISKKRKSQAKKITGFQFAPGNPSEILVTSADSQIRVFNGITVLQKFKGFKNTSSQISASYTADGRYVVCASEDSHVYIWRREPGASPVGGGGGGAGGASASIGVRAKTWLTSRSYEYFFCRDVSAAVPWPGSPPPPAATPRKPGGGADDAAGTPRGPMARAGAQLSAELSRRESSARWHGGADGGNAWGLVVVTANRGGEIRVYQNFGLPLATLFN